MEKQDHAVYTPWPDPVQLCTLGKFFRERLHSLRSARPRLVCMCRCRAERGLELPGCPYARAEDVSRRGGTCCAEPRATFLFAEYAKHDGKGCKSKAKRKSRLSVPRKR